MAVLEWDKVGEHLYETGIRQGVLYVYDNKQKQYGTGVAWNGLTSITESPSGAEETALWADDQKYLSMRSVEEYGGTIEAYTYPDEWEACDGSASPVKGVTLGQQKRAMFGLCYRTIVGNDTEGDDYGYKLHLVYGATASPSERQYQSVNDSPEANTMSWEFTTQPVTVSGFKPVSLITIDTTKLDEEGKKKLADLEKKLYGDMEAEPTLPTPAEVLTLMGYTSTMSLSDGYGFGGAIPFSSTPKE